MKNIFFLSILLFALVIFPGCSNVKNVNYEQIYVGFNGPKIPETYFFVDRASVENSWIKEAVTPDELSQILSRIDFDHQMLLAISNGESNTANGSVAIVQVRKIGDEKDGPFDVAVKIGSIDAGCNDSVVVSYPFAVAVLPRHEADHPYGDYTLSTFRNGCAPRKSGKPNDPAL